MEIAESIQIDSVKDHPTGVAVTNVRMKPWTLSQSSFDRFLEVLDADRDRAGQKYETLRTKLVKFFEWRACQFAEELADKTLDRAAKKIELGQVVEDPVRYAYSVAKFLYLESLRNQIPVNVAIETASGNGSDERELRFECLELCLEKLTDNCRMMILEYYGDAGQAKIILRSRLADRLGISLNALRIKTVRIRAKLEDCVFKCLDKNAA